MALSKVKQKKQDKRLAARIASFEAVPENRYSGHKFTKPGSNRK
jgi:hypothetical protein